MILTLPTLSSWGLTFRSNCLLKLKPRYCISINSTTAKISKLGFRFLPHSPNPLTTLALDQRELRIVVLVPIPIFKMSTAPAANAKGKRKAKDIQKDEKQKSILAYFSSPPKASSCSNGISLLKVSPSTAKDNEVSNADNSKRLKLEVTATTATVINDTEKDSKIRANLQALSKEFGILDLNMGLSWFDALKDEFGKDYFQKLNDFVVSARKQGTVYPPQENVWEWTKLTRIQDVKVVILGQDPYHGPNQAHGLCFSVKKGVRNPPSLNNIYKELCKDIDNFTTPSHGHLIGWADQGVLLLNAVLTVQAGKPNSHKDKGWEQLTDAVIRWISKNLDSVVFLLWGAYAQKKGAIVDKNKHHLLCSAHPSPFSCDRGFFGCGHFSKCNELLLSSGKQPIDWNRLP